MQKIVDKEIISSMDLDIHKLTKKIFNIENKEETEDDTYDEDKNQT